MKKALFTGITGQDGAYLAKLIKEITGFEAEGIWNTLNLTVPQENCWMCH